jgi:hypothetical protein
VAIAREYLALVSRRAKVAPLSANRQRPRRGVDTNPIWLFVSRTVPPVQIQGTPATAAVRSMSRRGTGRGRRRRLKLNLSGADTIIASEADE